MAKVFLSFAAADASRVEQIASGLKDAGHLVKLGRSSIDVVDSGGRLAACVLALKHSDVLVLALSHNAAKSRAIADELMLAERTHRVIVPIILDAVKLPPEIGKPLRYMTKIDCTGNFSDGMAKLLAALAK